jgi:hypothetical protein
MAGYLALGLSMEEAFRKTRLFIDISIRNAGMSLSGLFSVKPGG